MYTTLCILPTIFSSVSVFIFTYAPLDILDIRDTLDIHASGALAKLDIGSNYHSGQHY